jgi:hypothetical protein
MKKTMICAFGLTVLATPALAADEYWVVQDLSSKRCSVIRVTKDVGFFGWPFAEKPTGLAIINTAFKTRTAAQNSMKTTKSCS